MAQKPRQINLLELLAINSTKPACRLLDRYKQPRAKDYADLQVKLAELYGEHPDKILIEKEFANIHPHKEWIIQHCSPSETVIDEGTSNACGCQHSSFDGSGAEKNIAIDRHRAFELMAAMGLGIMIGAIIYRMASR